MSDAKDIMKTIFINFDFIFLIASGIIRFVFYFSIKETDLESIFTIFESSPLFNFDLRKSCDNDSHIIFHEYKGIKDSTKIVDRTDIDKINGYQFCYKYISYKELLYNNQIIKNNKKCEDNYPKDCGIIDTLEQHLCIKNDEKCPLYDIIIGEPENKELYINKEGINIYYNNDNYNNTNKKIIGNLILNDGQPCYKPNEKLWKKFINKEVDDNHLKCEFEIKGLTTDNRYEKQGDITYNQLYFDNLSEDSYKKLTTKINNGEYVSLYKREILGIDKSCDEKSDITKEKYEKLRNNQKKEKVCLLAESIIFISLLVFALIIIFLIVCSRPAHYKGDFAIMCLSFFLIIYLLSILACIICQSVFLSRIIKYDLSYDCSDKITNELLKEENKNTQKSIKLIAITLGLDSFLFFVNLLAGLIFLIKEKIC